MLSVQDWFRLANSMSCSVSEIEKKYDGHHTEVASRIFRFIQKKPAFGQIPLLLVWSLLKASDVSEQ